MIISANYIFHPRKSRNCAVCGLPINGIHVRMFGSAEKGDPPYVAWSHPNCAPIEAFNKLNKVKH